MNHVPLPDAIFHSLVHFAPDAFLVVTQEGEIVFANAQAETLFGYLRDQLIGQPVETLLPERFRSQHRDHRAEYHESPQARPMGSRLPLVGRRRDGTEVPVEVSLSPLYTDDEMYVTAIVRDVTDRRRMEEALQASEERYRLLAEQAKDVIYRIALNDTPRFEYISPSVETLTGYPPSAFYADPHLVSHVTHPDDRVLLQQWLDAPGEIAQPLSIRTVHRDGQVAWREERFTLVHDDDGRVIAIEGIARDVTEQRRLEEERRLLEAETEIERERERIAADLHDGVMQTMYSVGLQLSSVLRGSEHLPEGAAVEIEEAIASLNGAIQDIRRYVMDLQPADFTGELGPSVRALLNLFESSSGIEVSLNEEPDLPVLEESSAVEVFLLVREALSNVQRHAGASTLSVALCRKDDTLCLELQDDGDGFDADARHEFEHRGLRNMETRARLLGGRLEIDSAPGDGTSIKLIVPLDGQR